MSLPKGWRCWFGHRWEQYDKYYSTTRGMEHVILLDECSRCGAQSRLVGGPLIVLPMRDITRKPQR